jgi:CubicO group peptidase (beta-lactamase class C family)
MKRFRSPLFAATVTAVAVIAAAQPAHAPYTYAAPPSLDDGWTTASLAQTGVDRQRIEAMTTAIRTRPDLNIHAALIERDGRLVYEEYFSGKDERWGESLGVVNFNRSIKHDLRSITKSVVSALVGIAHHAGQIPSLDAPLLDYFPEFKDLQVPERRQISIRHALSMSAGFDWNEEIPYSDPRNDEIVMIRSRAPMRYVLSRPIIAPPGTAWRYNGGTTQVLGAIVQRATKQPLAEYARARLFAPLGITDFEWLGNLYGVPSAASGLRLVPRDLAKFASLYLHEGRWNGRRVLPEGWVEESTRRQIALPGGRSRGYGYQWWLGCYPTSSGSVEVPTGVGNGAQRVFVLRAHRTVVTFLAGRYNDFSLNPPEPMLRDYIIPALPAVPVSTCPS